MTPQRGACFGFACLGVLALSAAPSRADDSTATLRAGGLTLEKTDKIALVSEDLYLSPTAVKVSYRFRNLTNADQETIVAFPMPDVTGSVDMTVAIPDPGHDNFLRFVTRVDGKQVGSKVEQRAFLTASGKPDVEITERLKSLGLPLVPTMEAAGAALAALSAPQRKSLADAGIVYPLDVDVGKGAHLDWVPLWTLGSKFWRSQVFPAGRDLLVERTYTPGTGSQSSLTFGAADLSAAQESHYRETYCTDGPFTSAVQSLYRKANAPNSKVRAFEEYLSYVITSGANWAGPIGSFRLIVDKGDPQTLVSFCGDGVRKIAPTTFEMTAKDYTPRRDIDVLFIKSNLNR
ncbi:MAG: DUF4424 domain-containing protein [Roseiarcus sp.]